MDFDNMQSTMEFLLQQQAKHDVMMSELHQGFKILTELAQNHDERMDLVDPRTDSLEEELRLQVESFRAHLQAQREDFYLRLDAETQAFKDRLAESEAKRQAEWSQHETVHAALDGRLDRLVAIVEAQANTQQSPPSG